MIVYIVSWGVTDGENYIETESIVHQDLDDAREEFSALDPVEAAKGAIAEEAMKRGWKPVARLASVEILDENSNPTDDLSSWIYDGQQELLEEK